MTCVCITNCKKHLESRSKKTLDKIKLYAITIYWIEKFDIEITKTSGAKSSSHQDHQCKSSSQRFTSRTKLPKKGSMSNARFLVFRIPVPTDRNAVSVFPESSRIAEKPSSMSPTRPFLLWPHQSLRLPSWFQGGQPRHQFLPTSMPALTIGWINGHATGTENNWRYLYTIYFWPINFRPKFQGISPQFIWPKIRYRSVPP